ncbi:MAG TPA: LytTR family DNA-binding domain-containing protein [Steroidobacteraceae bacterium]|nr:LytTR family DNA-binding domain-containing protein [Steroidobacteraceae bacterium]
MGSRSDPMRALIVDDEEPGRSVLRSLLAREADVVITGEAASALEATRMIQELNPDVVFMDIEIPDGNGVELFRRLEQPVPYVIFVTAHPEYSLPAFELEAVDYLVKPVQRPRFAGSVERARRRIAERREAARARGTNGVRLGAPHDYPDQMTLRVRRRLVAVDMKDIVWIQGASQYSRVHTRNGEYLLSRTLASLECELDPSRFFRIHRSAIVNAAHVSEVRSSGDGRYNIHLENGLPLPMGRARREILEKLLSGIASNGSRGK